MVKWTFVQYGRWDEFVPLISALAGLPANTGGMPTKITPGMLHPREAAALTEGLGRVGGLELSGIGAGTVRVAGPNGQYLQMPAGLVSPPLPPPSPPATSNLGDPCLIPLVDGYTGAIIGVAGIAQRVVRADGTVVCKEYGFCDPACGRTSPIVPPPTPAACVTVSGSVAFQSEGIGAQTVLALAGYGPFASDVDGRYSVDLTFSAVTPAFTCYVPSGAGPRDVYYSFDGGGSWTLAGSAVAEGDAAGFDLELPEGCEPVEVLWELREPEPTTGSIKVTVTLSGVGNPGRTITWSGGGTFTDHADGTYTLSGVTPGSGNVLMSNGSLNSWFVTISDPASSGAISPSDPAVAGPVTVTAGVETAVTYQG